MLPQIGMPELLCLLVVFVLAVLLVVSIVFLVRRFQRDYGARYKRCPWSVPL